MFAKLARRAASVLVVAASTAAGVSPAVAQSGEWAPGKYMAQAVGEMMATVRQLTDMSEFGYADDEAACLVGVYLLPGAKYSIWRPFEAGRTYALCAGGDEDATDVDLEVLDSEGNVVVKDTSVDRGAAFLFTPLRSGKYSLRVTLYGSKREAFCAFAIMQRGGCDVPIVNLTTAGDGFLTLCRSVLTVRGGKLGFLTESNQAALFGVILRGGRGTEVTDVRMGAGTRLVLGAGDTQAQDLDIKVHTMGGSLVAEDVETDATPVNIFSTSSHESYKVTLQNAAQRENAVFAVFGVLQAE